METKAELEARTRGDNGDRYGKGSLRSGDPGANAAVEFVTIM